ncbi:hypothetical protein H0H92_009895 [Tricholoma furcatifolium]|nr:hypothetical protein H0H92_009895 [Tricholoma furcatifolium]
MITNARISTYAGNPSVWNKTTTEGATIQTALNFAMTLNASATGESAYVAELYPNVAAVGATYGDPDGKYAAFLAAGEATYATEAYFLWDQPLAGGEDIQASGTAGAAGATATGSKAKANDAAASRMVNWVLGASVIATLQYTLVL